MFECACTLTLITHCINPLAPDSTKTNFSEGGCGDTNGVSGLYNESSQMRSFAAAPSFDELLH